MHREPRDVVLISLQYKKPAVSYGEPQILTIRMTNTSEKPVPVGRDGVIRTTIGLAGTIREGNKSLGIFGVEDFQRATALDRTRSSKTRFRSTRASWPIFSRKAPTKPSRWESWSSPRRGFWRAVNSPSASAVRP